MAAEFEEPFSLSFLADSLHSGSISFGRFEAESLSWERRSSFSHNRYLEEVEKYSKPGLVTEKKAYFEAHFKRKALLSQSSSECQNAMEYQSSENGLSEHSGSKEEFERVNEARDFALFDKSPDGSESDEEYLVMEFGSKDVGVSSSEPRVEPALSNGGDVTDGFEHVKAEETFQTETADLSLVKAEPIKQVKENLHDEAVYVDMVSKTPNPSPSSHADGKVDSVTPENQQDTSAKARSASEAKLTKNGLKPQGNVHVRQVQRNVLGEAYENPTMNSHRRKGEGSTRLKTERQSSHTAAPTTCSVHRISKLEDYGNTKREVNQQNKSGNNLRVKKAVEPLHSASEKVFPRTRQTANRPKQTVNSSGPSLKKNAAVFNIKSNGRAEMRKEEKTVAETKPLQRSLNFKATPMPSFYHEAIKHRSNSKAVASTPKSTKLRSKSSSSGERDTASSPHLKAGNDKAISSDRCTKTENDFSLEKNRVPDNSKATKGQKTEQQQKLKAGRRNNEMARKGMRSIHTKTSSGIACMALGVAS